jgi:predicted negative regulator of RcsB-dependent stress response
MSGKPQNVFHVKLEEQPKIGVLDQFELPPEVITFLQKNQRTIWKVVIAIAVVVTASSLYSSWREYTRNKAAMAYDQAIAPEDIKQKAVALQKVAEEYGTAPAGVWSRIALAHLDQEAGKIKEAIAKLTAVDAETPVKSPLKPLLLVNLGGLYEQEKQFDKAEAVYLQLKDSKGFEPMALNSLGRVYEAIGSKDKAVQMYQQYMGLTEMGKEKKEGAPTVKFPEQEIVKASLNRLLK